MLFLVVLFLLSPIQTQPPIEEPFSCFDELPVPKYPTLARFGGRQGEVRATILFTTGTPEVQVAGPENLLNEEVKKSLTGATARSSCRGKTGNIRVVFQLDRRRLECPENTFVLRPPDTLVVRSTLPPVSPK